MSGIPIIRLELEGMKLAILSAFSDYQAAADEQVKAAMEKFCSPGNIRNIVEQCVERELKAAIEKEISSFFQYGDGRRFLAAAVKDKLSESFGGEGD